MSEKWDRLREVAYAAAQGHATDADLMSEMTAADVVELFEAIDRLAACDCVGSVVSSRSCQKCGRRGVMTRDEWIAFVGKSNRMHAALEPLAEQADLIDSWQGGPPIPAMAFREEFYEARRVLRS